MLQRKISCQKRAQKKIVTPRQKKGNRSMCRFFFSSRRRHTRWTGDWSSDVCSSDLSSRAGPGAGARVRVRGGAGREGERSQHPAAPRHHPDHGAGARRKEPVSRQSRGGSPHARGGAVNDLLMQRLMRKLEVLPEDKAYQVLDYVEFLESKYADRPAGAPAFQKVAETLEDTMRAGRVPVTVIKGTMDAVGKAGKFLEGLAAAGKAAVDEVRRTEPKPAEEKPKVESEPPPA